MSTLIPAPVTRPVVAVLPVDEPGEHAGRPPVAERDESQDLPEGALAWLAQLQPLPEPLSRLSTGLKQARGGAPEKAPVAAAPMVAQMPVGAKVQGPLAARGGPSTPMRVAGGAAVAMAVPALVQPLTESARAVPTTTPETQLPALPAGMRLPTPPENQLALVLPKTLVTQLPALPGGMRLPTPLANEPVLALPKTPATQLPARPAAMELPGASAVKPLPLLAMTPTMPLPMSDITRVPGNGSAAMAESPAQSVPVNALQGLATTASATPVANPGTETGTTSADGDTPPPQSAQLLPPALERTARAQAAAPQAAFNPPPTGKPEVFAEKAAQPYLQVPFSKGDCAGVVTVHKAPADMPQQLLLSPSNAQVSDHLRDGLELAPQTLWQLHEQHEQAHDERRQHDAGDDEAQDDAPQALARMPAFQGVKP